MESGANYLGGFLDQEEIDLLAAGEGRINLDELNDQEADQTGEKAEDALDFGDISDEDLAEDDEGPVVKAEARAEAEAEDLPDGDIDDDLDALFGDDPQSPLPDVPFDATSPAPKREVNDSPQVAGSDSDDGVDDEDDNEDEAAGLEEGGGDDADVEREEEEEEEEDAETREQRLLFEQARVEREGRLVGAKETPRPLWNDEFFNAVWPQFDRDRPLRFGELLPGKKAYYLGKTPARQPRPIQPTKVNLELEPDQEKLFRVPAAPPLSLEDQTADAEAKGLVLIARPDSEGESSEEDQEFDLANESEEVGGVSWPDLVAICQDWDVPDTLSSTDESATLLEDDHVKDLFLNQDEFDTLENPRPLKRRKIEQSGSDGPLRMLHNLNVSFEDPQRTTARLARKVQLDMNDPLMLIDERPPVKPQQRHVRSAQRRDTAGGLTKDLIRRYNISNDDAYDLLKQNHQSRVRSQVGNTPIGHAGVAMRLQYPFYKQHLNRKEARSWHRSTLFVVPGVNLFKKPITHKRRFMRPREPIDNFPLAADMSICDNSHVALFEYSEETPPMLNSFGMGSRLINYYRRKDEQDTSRPKQDIGETAVLLPQDKSPFDIFGDVDRGQTVPTLSNSMYRAPVFRHSPRQTDFLVSKSTTGREGAIWHIRNVDNLHVVGQEFPFVDVPGPKARFATNVAKGRLQMVSYRMFNKSKGRLSMDMVKRHNPHTDIPTIRTKMREFMNFDKSAGQGKGVWVPRDATDVPDETSLRGLVKPEEVSLLYAMQVGQQHLSDAGYHKQGDDEDAAEDDNDDANAPAGNLDKQLAPWKTTKAFLLSCQDKAMIEVYGDGDPTGRGEALSMIKTSMKGGFKAVGQSIEDRLDANRQRELGGHKYNVAKQRQEYVDAIRRVWDSQYKSLSSSELHEDIDMGGVEDQTLARVDTPAPKGSKGRAEDESASFISKASSQDQSGNVLRITRVFVGKFGDNKTVEEVVTDPAVIREYTRRRRLQQLEKLSLGELEPTGDAEQDALRARKLKDELERLRRNVERREVREKAKGVTASSPATATGLSPDAEGVAPSAGPKRKTVAGTTQRKCANCGLVGHIKTNKKLCPMLNGTMQSHDAAGESAFGAIANPTPGLPS